MEQTMEAQGLFETRTFACGAHPTMYCQKKPLKKMSRLLAILLVLSLLSKRHISHSMTLRAKSIYLEDANW